MGLNLFESPRPKHIFDDGGYTGCVSGWIFKFEAVPSLKFHCFPRANFYMLMSESQSAGTHAGLRAFVRPG